MQKANELINSTWEPIEQPIKTTHLFRIYTLFFLLLVLLLLLFFIFQLLINTKLVLCICHILPIFMRSIIHGIIFVIPVCRLLNSIHLTNRHCPIYHFENNGKKQKLIHERMVLRHKKQTKEREKRATKNHINNVHIVCCCVPVPLVKLCKLRGIEV